MPRFTVGFGGVDPFRVAEQIKVVALFYAGVAYSMGALAASHNLLGKFLGHSRSVQPEPEQNDERTSREARLTLNWTACRPRLQFGQSQTD